MNQVDGLRLIGLAKFERVAEAIAREIRAGTAVRGEQQDSEGALMRRFALSRITVRRGLQILTDRGMVTTRTGFGSFVTYGEDTIDDRKGWSIALSRGPESVTTRILDLRRDCFTRSDTFLNDRGQVPVGDFLHLDRLRILADTAQGVSLERSRLPWRPVLSRILDCGLTNGTPSQSLAALNLQPNGGQEVAGILPSLSQGMATVMQNTMLRLQRLTRAKDGSVLNYVESILDPDRFGLRVVF